MLLTTEYNGTVDKGGKMDLPITSKFNCYVFLKEDPKLKSKDTKSNSKSTRVFKKILYNTSKYINEYYMSL